MLPRHTYIHATCNWAGSGIYHAAIPGFEDYFPGLGLPVHVRHGVSGVALYKLLNRICNRGFFSKGKLSFILDEVKGLGDMLRNERGCF